MAEIITNVPLHSLANDARHGQRCLNWICAFVCLSVCLDVCPSGFIRHLSSCYLFENATCSWIDAEKRCQSLNPRSHLVSVDTEDEEEFLLQYRSYNAGRQRFAGSRNFFQTCRFQRRRRRRHLVWSQWWIQTLKKFSTELGVVCLVLVSTSLK